ncbi:hypothetical protein M3172_13275 [Mesobacillus subterraneus]|uniref:hypothetical protein n=1 Tax=Mesobacillus subterraneus TaxID=285983 RepID=UPI00203F9FB6|nr:hypothetical protein [Mesobacillus subterraneus]MCM3574161.1 hypothetical protein [Mesobacillus subterraneus]
MKKITISLTLAAVITGGFLGANYINNQQASADNLVVREAHANFIDDFSDKRKLVGATDNVFIGKVIEQAGSKSLDGGPETQFTVEVISTVKGKLSGEVLVNQQGGYLENEEGETELLLIEDDQLLVPGETYLFATRYLESENWHTVVPAYGDIKIDSEAKKSEIMKAFKEAYKNQVIPADLKDKK